MFAIAADAVQEIRSTDSLAGAAMKSSSPTCRRSATPFERSTPHILRRQRRRAFRLAVTRPTLVLILRQLRVAVLVDRIERMAEIARVSCDCLWHSAETSAAGIAAWLIWMTT